MTRIILPVAILVTTLVFAPQAHAIPLLTRTFVSSSGNDNNPCTIAQPCATFAAAYVAVASNGIVAAIDPGKYGPLTIMKPVTINGQGWAAITGPSGDNAITINTPGTVKLRGLALDGAGTAANGVSVSNVTSLEIMDCNISVFTNAGIVVALNSPSATSVIISNTTVTDVSNTGAHNGTGVAILSNGTINAALNQVNTVQ